VFAISVPRLIPVLVLAVLAAALPASAHAGFFAAETIDPDPGVTRVGDVDLSRDGNGLVGYIRRDSGVEHAFVSRFLDGTFQPPERVDGGLALPSSQPVVAASDSGRLAVAYVNDGRLWTMVKPKDAASFAAPTVVAEGGVSNPSIDMSINGAIYVSWTQSGDVRVARANRDTPQFQGIPSVMDVDQARTAGDGERKASRVVVSADGTALVVWGEDGNDGRTHVYARRIFELRPSTAPQDLTLQDVDGQAAGNAEYPEVDIEDDSSFAQVVFRQNTAGGPRVVMRRLLGSQFDPHIVADGGGRGVRARIDLTGRGEGLVATAMAGNEVFGASIFANKFNSFSRFDGGNSIEPMPVAAIGENEDGAVAWFQGSATDNAEVRAQYLHNIERPEPEPQTVVSSGPVDATAGMDAAASRAGDVAVVFVQGKNGERRLAAGIYDKPPNRNAGYTTQKPRRLRKLRWAPSLNLFGPVRYRILLDGRPIAETGQQELIVQPGQVPDGEHRWQIVAIDRRNQETPSRSRLLRVDNTPPTLRIGVRRKRRVVTVTAKGGDPDGSFPTGLRRILVDFGDGRLQRMGRKASKRYARTGGYTVRVKAVDKAGNETIQQRRIRIG
jgi:hypothetical protein